MLYKIGVESEGCVTDGTSERFVPGVYINMLLQTIFRRKCLPALLAFVLFIAIVPEHVQVEILLCDKLSVAYLTLKLALAVHILFMLG